MVAGTFALLARQRASTATVGRGVPEADGTYLAPGPVYLVVPPWIKYVNIKRQLAEVVDAELLYCLLYFWSLRKESTP